MEDASPQADKSAPCRTLRPYFSRSRGACMLCRQRKKKCDERKPSCWTCTRSGRKCVYPVAKGNAGGSGGSGTKDQDLVIGTGQATETVTIVDLTGRKAGSGLEGEAFDNGAIENIENRREESTNTDIQPISSSFSSRRPVTPVPLAKMVSSSTQTDPMINTETVQPQAVSSLASGLQQLQSTKPQQLPPLVEPPGTDSKPAPAQDASSQCIRPRGMQLQSAHPIQQHAHSPQNLRDRQLSPKFPSRVPVSPKLQTCSDSSKRSVYSSAFSNNFLEHYLHMTTEILVSNTKAENPFLQYVMPLAHSDDSLMEAVLCLGGTHLCASMETPDPAVRKATLGLYGLVLHRLREKMMSGSTAMHDRQHKLRVMTIVMLLCQIESLQRHHRGTIFPHLRAFRSILISLQDEMPSSFDSIEEKLQGSMLEIYSYLVLVANITPYGLDENRTLPFDSFLFSFGEKVAGLDSSGVIFSSIDGLFSLIPSVSLLARQRLEEPDNSPSAGLMRKFTELEQRISGWEPPADTAVVWDADRDSLASVYRHALLVYLKTARCGAVVGDVRVIQDVQEHVNSAIATMMSLAMSTMCAVLLWPVMIVGSCLIVKPQQNMVYEGLRYSRYKTANVLQAIELLEKLWRDPAPEAYGPYGLHYVMKKTGISLCMS